MRIAPFDVAEASERDLRDYYELFLADTRLERPEDQVPTYESAVGRLRTPILALGRSLYWAAYADGRLTGLLSVGLPANENDWQAITDVRVHPASRRLGIGTALLRAALPVIGEHGRTNIAGRGVTEGASGAAFASALGFRIVHRMVLQELDLARVDHDVPAPAGYRLASWVGSAPDDLLTSYAHARTGIEDLPLGESSFRPPSWTAQRVRDAEARGREQGVEQRVVAAVHQDSGAVVGLTEIELYPHRPDVGIQQDTAVLAEHRGHGIGRWMKAHMTKWLMAERPALSHIRTTTAADNVHMIRVNTQLGYAIIRTMQTVEAQTSALVAALGWDRVAPLADPTQETPRLTGRPAGA